jgi:hypothetical protein
VKACASAHAAAPAQKVTAVPDGPVSPARIQPVPRGPSIWPMDAAAVMTPKSRSRVFSVEIRATMVCAPTMIIIVPRPRAMVTMPTVVSEGAMAGPPEPTPSRRVPAMKTGAGR